MIYEPGSGKTDIIAALAKEIWSEHYSSIIPPDMLSGMISSHQSSEAILRKINEGYEYFLMTLDAPVGYFAVKETDSGLYLDKAYIKKDFRGKGFFKDLVTYLEKLCKTKGICRIYLSVNSKNESSVCAYKACGFEICGEKTNDFGNGAVFRDFIMQKNIQK